MYAEPVHLHACTASMLLACAIIALCWTAARRCLMWHAQKKAAEDLILLFLLNCALFQPLQASIASFYRLPCKKLIVHVLVSCSMVALCKLHCLNVSLGFVQETSKKVCSHHEASPSKNHTSCAPCIQHLAIGEPWLKGQRN